MPVHIILSNGKYTTLKTHKFDMDVSSTDSSLTIPINIEKTKSGVDTLRLQVSNEEGVEFINQEIAIGLLHHDKAIFLHQGPNIYLENHYLSILAREKCQPGANFLEVSHKQSKLFMTGHSLNLGLPFQEWGSEFYKTDLEHNFYEASPIFLNQTNNQCDCSKCICLNPPPCQPRMDSGECIVPVLEDNCQHQPECIYSDL